MLNQLREDVENRRIEAAKLLTPKTSKPAQTNLFSNIPDFIKS